MAQQINDNFQVLAALPIDDRIRKSTIADRDAISSTRRFTGLQCFVDQTQTLYQLQSGILNSNWVGIAGLNVANNLETVIEGFYVLSAGKTTPLDWEVGDKFRGWIGSRYVVGEILALPVSLPGDIDNPAKVHLAIDSDNIIAISTDEVINESSVSGATSTDALNTLNTEKADDSNVIHTTGDETKSGILNMADKIQFGTAKTTYGQAIGVSKTLTAMNVHIIDDYSILNSATSPAQGFGTFDASTEMTGTANYDHFQAYQSRLNYTGSGDITGSYGLAGLFIGNGHNGAGTIGSNFGIHIFDIEGTGDVNYSSGITIEPITRGSVENWAIDSGGGDFRFRGNVLNLNGKGYYSFSVGDPLATNQKSVSFVSDANSSFYSIGTGSQAPGNFVFYSYDGGPVVERLNINATTGVIKIPSLSGTGTRQVVADASGNLSASSTPIDSRPYKVYSFSITQVGTSAPTVLVLENTLGGSVTWSRVGIGSYNGTLTGAFTLNKTYSIGANSYNAGIPTNVTVRRSSNDAFNVVSLSPSGSADGLLTDVFIEVRVYN